MSQDRRSFIRAFGAALGSLIVSGSLSGCGPKKEGDLSGTKQEGGMQDEASANTQMLSSVEWEQMGQCWLSLKTVNEEVGRAFRDTADRRKNGTMTGEEWGALEDAIPRRRVTAHQTSLDALISKCQLKEPVAKHMQVAFEEAIYHVVRSRGTCYMGTPLAHAPRKDLLQQADLLSKISGDLDPSTVAKAQAAIVQDIAFFETFETYTTFVTVKTYKGRPSNGIQLLGDYEAGNLKASPEALEAARLLTRLFVETPD